MFAGIGAERLPPLPPEIGLVLREQLPLVDQVHLRRAIETAPPGVEGEDPSNALSLPFAGLLADEAPAAEYLRSVPLFREYMAAHPDFYNPILLVKNAPVEVVILYCELWIPRPDLSPIPSHAYCTGWGRYDLGRLIYEPATQSMSPLVPPEFVHEEVTPEAIESVFRSYAPEHRNAYARLVAKAARVDALRFIHRKRHPLNVAVADVVSTTNEQATIQTMHWIREQGKPWKRDNQRFKPSIFRSLKVVQWLDRNGYPFDLYDWWVVFHRPLPPNMPQPPNMDVVRFLFEKDIQIPNFHPDAILDAINIWWQRQQDRWKAQLASIDALQSARPHNFPREMVLRAPHVTARLVLQRQEIAPAFLLIFNRYDLLTPVQLEPFYQLDLRDDQAEALDKDTLVTIYNTARKHLARSFVTQLMVHGRVDVLRSIHISRNRTIFDAFYKDLGKAKRTIEWALSIGMPWGVYEVPEDEDGNPDLVSYYKSKGAPIPP